MIYVNIEITGVILRLSDEPEARTYDATMYISGDEGVATIKAAMNVPPGSHAAVRQALRGLGFHKMRWSRHRKGDTVTQEEFSLVAKGS